MKLLYWKEWREMRTLPLVAGMTYIAFLLVAATIGALTHSAVQWQNVIALLALTWYIFAFSSGSGTISQEVGGGTLEFVSVMPISRKRFWWIKICAALIGFLAVILLTTLVCYMITISCYSGDLKDFLRLLAVSSYDQRVTQLSISLTIIVSVICSFAAGVCASPFFDRPIAATVAALIGGIFYASVVTKAYLKAGVFKSADTHAGRAEFHTLSLSNGDYWTMLAVAAALTAIGLLPLILTSFYTTKFGESLKSAKRFSVGAIAAVGSSLFSTALFAIGHLCKLW